MYSAMEKTQKRIELYCFTSQVGFAELKKTADNRANIGGTIIGGTIIGAPIAGQ